jgi:DNA-binding FrmR family transcriptional regulator
MPDQEQRKAIISRLRRVEGQIGGLQRMIEQERSCEEIIVQMSAARAALDKTALLILRQHLAECLLDSEPGEQGENLDRALDLLFKLRS